jgi:hypothetical protein
VKKYHYLVHASLYYVAWFSCIRLASHGDAWLSSFIVIICALSQIYWQYKTQHNTRGLWYLIGIVVFVSTLIDSLLSSNGIVIYAANPFYPYATSPWMIAIWISFTVTLYAILSKIFNHLMLLALLSFFGFAFTYAVASKMGAVLFPFGNNTCFLIGGIWLIMLPFAVYCYQKTMGIKWIIN